MNNLENKIEAVLFWKGEPVSLKKLCEIFEKSDEEILSALSNIENALANRGICLVRKENEFALGASKDCSQLIEKLTKEELVRDLGKAGLETLSIIIYKGPISRAEIDYIRGVQSTFILRNLLVRGLIEKITNPKDQRSFLYKPTFELLSYLGITKIENMPEYLKVKEEFESFNAQKEEVKKEEDKENISEEKQ